MCTSETLPTPRRRRRVDSKGMIFEKERKKWPRSAAGIVYAVKDRKGSIPERGKKSDKPRNGDFVVTVLN